MPTTFHQPQTPAAALPARPGGHGFDEVEIRSNKDVLPCLSVVMAVFNEGKTVGEIIRFVLEQRPVQELIVVDDCSSDETGPTLRALAECDSRIKLRQQEVNRGKGAALRWGIQEARSSYVIIQDADSEYDPREYYLLLRPLLSGKADVVYGSRFLGSGAHRVLYYWHSFGNKILTTLSNVFTNLNLTDMETCYKCFRREVIQALDLREQRFGFEPEITAKISRRGLRIYEVPISYYGRTYAEGKKIRWGDGVSALRCILKYNLFSRR